MKKFMKFVSAVAAVSLVAAPLAVSADEKTFLLGGSGPLTGAAASYGTSVKQGAEIAIQEINDAGGAQVGEDTYKFELAFEDDEATEDKAVQAYNTLMDKGINGFLGCTTSGSCIAVAQLSQQDGILQITPSGSAEGCIEPDNAFRICFSDPEQGVAMADYAVDTLGYKKIAVLYNVADEYSTGIYDAFTAEVEAKGAEIVDAESFNTGDVDFNSQLTSIKGTDAEAIYVPAYYQDITYITKQASELGMELPFLGSDGWDGVLKTVTDPATVEGCIFTSPFCASVDDEKVVNFVKAYQDAYGETPDQFAADAYDGVYAIKAAAEKAEITPDMSTSDICDALKTAMTEIQIDGLTGTEMHWTAEGEPQKAPKAVEIKDGKYEMMQ